MAEEGEHTGVGVTMSQGDCVPEGVLAIDGITEEEDIEVIDTTKKSDGV